MDDARFRVNVPQVIHESIDGEVIVINLGTGSYYSLKGSGAHVWDALDRAGTATPSQLADVLARRYEASREDLEAGVGALLAQLREEDIVVAADASPAPSSDVEPAADSGIAKEPFATPVLEKFTDMQDLVLLDPVHEVDATGWPQPRPDDAAAVGR